MFKFSHIYKQSFTIGTSASMVAILLVSMFSILTLVLIKGSQHFWPPELYRLDYQQGPQTQSAYVSIIQEHQAQLTSSEQQEWLFQANQQHQASTLFLFPEQILNLQKQDNIAHIQLSDGRQLYAKATSLRNHLGQDVDLRDIYSTIERVHKLLNSLNSFRQGELADIHRKLSAMNISRVSAQAPARQKLEERYVILQKELSHLQGQLSEATLTVEYAQGQQQELSIGDIRYFSLPNTLSLSDTVSYATSRFWHFMTGTPLQANSAGGIFPALFGTVLMVLLMTLLVTPLGVIAAIYLYEYAKDNLFTSFLRATINNLAGIPSIVYGVFGLGFFVHSMGGSIDQLFYEESLPAPTFGTPGLIWASMTMALLTLPVVIVATEEGLRRVPLKLRLGSYALGATKAETLWKTVLPIASPGMMTGVILAIGRGAGEVAPLMLVGAAKFAPTLPIDSEFPYLHLERQFMHLGTMVFDSALHNYQVGQQSAFLFAICLVLLMIVFALNLCAIWIRSKLRSHYHFWDR